MRMTRRLLSVMLALVLAMGIFAPTTLFANEISVTINGTPVVFESQGPVIVDNRTLVPVTDVFRALGFSSSWDGATRQTTLTNNDHRIVITIDSDAFFVNGAPRTLDVPAQIINDRNMLPIRAVLEAVGKEIDWDGTTQTVLITFDPNTDTVYVRDDGVVFTRDYDNLWIEEPPSDWGWSGYGIWNDDYSNPFGQLQWINDNMRNSGFRPVENAILVWAFHDGPHPSEGFQFNVRHVPIWYYYTHYRNHFVRPAVSNGNFLSTYEHFINTQARPNATGRTSQFWAGYGNPVLSLPPINPHLDQGARSALQLGFSNDEIRHIFPFSVTFFNRHTNNVENHFWVTWDNEEAWGVYLGSATAVGIRAEMGSSARSHAATAAHELAHSLGLNEHLAHMFDDVMVGFAAPVAEITFESEIWTAYHWGWSPAGEWVILYTTERIEENAHRIYDYGGWARGALYRSSAMDWILMDLAGPVTFWEAVFWHDDSKYRGLWNQHLGHIASFETMQLARAGHEAVLRNSGLRQSFTNATGQRDPDDLSHIGTSFLNAFDTGLSQAQRNHYRNIAQQDISAIANWARQQGLQPYPSHYENYMPMRTIITPIN
ncbi:MAG: copper amine oxidase N-terminal domain-containing protein [Defluviitaleaceae bacterium]|nr:copper amine oxidase N-terminal domain-containing protein [Defluviitaleaceae bacterium]